MKKCLNTKCGSNVKTSCTIGGGPACSFFIPESEQPAVSAYSPATGSVPSVHETYEMMANLWISFDQGYDTFIMCMNSIADLIKEKEHNVKPDPRGD